MGAILGTVRSETPAHVVLRQSSGYQVWRYPSSVAAVVFADDLSKPGTEPLTDRAFRNAAFGTLARYIGVFSTPQNEISITPSGSAASSTSDASSKIPEKIAMTAPVLMTAPQNIAMTAPVLMQNAQVRESMRFLLPAKYQRVEDAPVPTNPNVKLEMAPAGRVEAVLTFSGDLDMKVAAERAHELQEMLKSDGLTPTGHWTACGYNPPFTLSMLKRNEIHFPLDPAGFVDEGRE